MAKRFHESIRKQGMEYVHSLEQQDGAMIKEDRSAMSLLPQNVVIKEYPKAEYFLTDVLNDTITGIDHQMNTLDGAKIRRMKAPKKV